MISVSDDGRPDWQNLACGRSLARAVFLVRRLLRLPASPPPSTQLCMWVSRIGNHRFNHKQPVWLQIADTERADVCRDLKNVREGLLLYDGASCRLLNDNARVGLDAHDVPGARATVRQRSLWPAPDSKVPDGHEMKGYVGAQTFQGSQSSVSIQRSSLSRFMHSDRSSLTIWVPCA
jgi:hypothetical protein